MHKIAFIKFCGLAASGIEKFLQNFAVLLSENEFQIDYYYTNNCEFTDGHKHADNDGQRKIFLENSKVNLIEVDVEKRIGGRDNLPWVNSNLFDLYDEYNYDLTIFAGRGVDEYPLNNINKSKVLFSVHGDDAYKQSNIYKYLLICNWQKNRWTRNGGDLEKSKVLAPIVPVTENKNNLREKLGLKNDTFVYGMHQANRHGLFNGMCLEAYKKIENENNFFIMLGGEDSYRRYSKELGIKNIKFIEETGITENIHAFLNTLNVYTHSRADGEVCSSALTEALYHKLPILSHPAANMGHFEHIEGNGLLTASVDEYANEMKRLETDKEYYQNISENSCNKYKNKYNFKLLEQKYIDLVKGIIYN